MRFLNASVLERKALNRNLSCGFSLGNFLPKTRVLKHRVLERKRRPPAIHLPFALDDAFLFWLSAERTKIAKCSRSDFPSQGSNGKEILQNERGFSLEIRRIKLQSLAMEVRTFRSQCFCVYKLSRNRADFRPAVAIRNRNRKNRATSGHSDLGRTPKRSHSRRGGGSRHLLKPPFKNPFRELLFKVKTIAIRNKEKVFFEGVLQECTPLLAVALGVPHVLLGPTSLRILC